MKRVIVILLILFGICAWASGAPDVDLIESRSVSNQQWQYAKVHPVPYFDYSIPRDVYTQIYVVVTTKAYMTYTVIQSITGQTVYAGKSMGYGIPADTSLTNPLRGVGTPSSFVAIEQPEPNGLFSSKNTDGTWVLFVLDDGSIAPVYTEHKVTTFPFPVKQMGNGSWVRDGDAPVEFTIDMK